MLTVESHEYDETTGIDTYVFNPGAMKALVKVIDSDGSPQVLLGVASMTDEQQGGVEPRWTVCRNKEIEAIALEDYAQRTV